LDTNPGFIGVKRELVCCDLVIAARMHCAVNAVAAGVPTVFLAYSQKATGMSHYVYGTSRWAVPVKDFVGDSMLQIVGDLLSHRHAISSFLQERTPLIQNDARRPLQQLEMVCASQCASAMRGAHRRRHRGSLMRHIDRD
ncbi:MAG: hypothetical protein GXY83_01790, partial [Rhodopirellula sp.]|nr:hypothetical protein [Rhodopirellula sp.]